MRDVTPVQTTKCSTDGVPLCRDGCRVSRNRESSPFTRLRVEPGSRRLYVGLLDHTYLPTLRRHVTRARRRLGRRTDPPSPWAISLWCVTRTDSYLTPFHTHRPRLRTGLLSFSVPGGGGGSGRRHEVERVSRVRTTDPRPSRRGRRGRREPPGFFRFEFPG